MAAMEACQATHLSIYTALEALTLKMHTLTLLRTAGNASFCNANCEANLNNSLAHLTCCL
jgi:hypothetical protein